MTQHSNALSGAAGFFDPSGEIRNLTIDPRRRRGRGSVSNRSGRYEPQTYEDFDDGWESLLDSDRMRTTVTEERPKKIITRNTSPDIGFDRSINA